MQMPECGEPWDRPWVNKWQESITWNCWKGGITGDRFGWWPVLTSIPKLPRIREEYSERALLWGCPTLHASRLLKVEPGYELLPRTQCWARLGWASATFPWVWLCQLCAQQRSQLMEGEWSFSWTLGQLGKLSLAVSHCVLFLFHLQQMITRKLEKRRNKDGRMTLGIWQ